MHGLERHPLVAGRTIAWHARVYERDGQRCTAGPTTFRLPSGIMVDCDVPLLQLLMACSSAAAATRRRERQLSFPF